MTIEKVLKDLQDLAIEKLEAPSKSLETALKNTHLDPIHSQFHITKAILGVTDFMNELSKITKSYEESTNVRT